MSTKAYYPIAEIGAGKVGFSKKRSIIEGEFYGNNVVKVNTLKEAEYKIDSIDVKNRNRSSKPPFITSTLQQDAGARLKYNAKRVMMIAQKLYEGIDLGDERVGLITYMRTDAVNLSKEAIEACRSAIVKYFGEEYLPKTAKEYKNKSKKRRKRKRILLR